MIASREALVGSSVVLAVSTSPERTLITSSAGTTADDTVPT
jgi:hypothetical protein